MKNAVLIPAFNEEKNILEVINKTKKLKRIDKIIVVDDGSVDKTAELAKKAGAIVIRHEKNKGKGEALKTGFDYISKLGGIKNIVLIDADLQYEPEESLKLLKALESADVVMGYRDFSKLPFRHKLGNFVWRTFFNLFFGTRLKDTNCGLIALTIDSIKKMDIHGGYIIENSMLASAIKNNLKIKQVLVNVNYKKTSGIERGIRVEAGVLIFILVEGIKYRMRLNDIKSHK
jgi:glycosyltransferase involved in cell wall biosynthesis